MKKMTLLAILALSTGMLNALTVDEIKSKLAQKNIPEVDFSAATDKVDLNAPRFESAYAHALYQQALQALKVGNTNRALSALKQIVDDSTLLQGAKDGGIYDNVVSHLEKLVA